MGLLNNFTFKGVVGGGGLLDLNRSLLLIVSHRKCQDLLTLSVSATGDVITNYEVHLNLEELLELQHQREPVSFTIPFTTFHA